MAGQNPVLEDWGPSSTWGLNPIDKITSINSDQRPEVKAQRQLEEAVREFSVITDGRWNPVTWSLRRDEGHHRTVRHAFKRPETKHGRAERRERREAHAKGDNEQYDSDNTSDNAERNGTHGDETS